MLYPSQIRQKHARNRLYLAVCAAVLCVVFALGFYFVSQDLKAQGAQSARQAILDAANQCMAIEGCYPTSLAYLENEYGLAVNTTDFDITYEVFAENVMPTVEVTPR